MMPPPRRCSKSLFLMSWDARHPLFLHKVQVCSLPCLQDPDRKGNTPLPTRHSISRGTCPPFHGISCASPPSLNGGSSHCWDGCIHRSSPKLWASLISLPSPSPAFYSSWFHLWRRRCRCWNGMKCSRRHPMKVCPYCVPQQMQRHPLIHQ